MELYFLFKWSNTVYKNRKETILCIYPYFCSVCCFFILPHAPGSLLYLFLSISQSLQEGVLVTKSLSLPYMRMLWFPFHFWVTALPDIEFIIDIFFSAFEKYCATCFWFPCFQIRHLLSFKLLFLKVMHHVYECLRDFSVALVFRSFIMMYLSLRGAAVLVCPVWCLVRFLNL